MWKHFSLSLSLSRLICIAKVCTFNILRHKFWGCENSFGCLITFVTHCVWWRMKVVVWGGGCLKVMCSVSSLIWLKPNQWYKHSEIVSFTVTYMFICIQSGIFPISVVGHLQMLFRLCRLSDVTCCVADHRSRCLSSWTVRGFLLNQLGQNVFEHPGRIVFLFGSEYMFIYMW